MAADENYTHRGRSTIAVGQSGLFSTKDLPAGRLILSLSRPLLSILDSENIRDACANCFLWQPSDRAAGSTSLHDGKEVSLKACRGCRTNQYCSKACQSNDWKRHHKDECKTFAVAAPKIFPTAVRSILRLWLARDSQRIDDDQWSALMGLQSHQDEYRQQPPVNDRNAWTDVSELGQWAHLRSGGPLIKGNKLPEDLAVDLCCKVHHFPDFSMLPALTVTPHELADMLNRKIKVNSLTLVTPELDAIGASMDPLIASVNHSCDPNAVVVFDGARLSLRSLNAIREDEEITISYIDNTQSFEQRQTELRKQWFFSCSCSKCQQGVGGREDRLFAAASQEPYLERIKRATILRDRTDTEEAGDVKYQSAVQANKIMTKLGTVWPLDVQPWPKIRESLVQTMMYTQRWSQAFAQSLLLYFSVDPLVYPRAGHPSLTVHKWRLSSMVMQISFEAVAMGARHPLAKYGVNYGIVSLGLMVEAAAHAEMSHGAENVLTRTVTGKVAAIREQFEKTNMTDRWPAEGSRVKAEEWAILRSIAATAEGQGRPSSSESSSSTAP